MIHRHPAPLITALAGVVLITAYAVVAALQILIWNPLAAAPGLDLAQIHAEMTEANEGIFTGFVVGFLAIGPLLAIGVALTALRRTATVSGLAFAMLSIVVFGMPAYFVASFGPGMALADTFGISGADYSPWALPLYLTSLAAFLTIVVLAVIAVRRRPAATQAPATV